ncbi:MAG: EpsG family protein [Pedobacter sp.]|uniref:EpsG family protein n=1 Tax=Pedobacter sp. TaxID=1411316 RepID=UPI002808B9A1|nr:EpsG family protein [Pedobacter sp.]MDQ8004315.1 EpsG family protein [Pedobacter sp.]
MAIYLFVFLLLSIAAIVETLGQRVSAAIILGVSLFVLLILTIFREGIGTDFYNYKKIYEETTNQQLYSTEWGFIILNYISMLFGGFRAVLGFCALINIVAILFVLSKWRLNLSLGFLTYYSLFFLNHNFNTIRHGLMATLVWVGITLYSNRKVVKSFLAYFLATSFHQIGIILLPFQFLYKIKIRFFFEILILIFLYVIGNLAQNLFGIINLFFSSSRLEYYENDFYAEGVARYKFGLGFLLYLVVYVTFRLCAKYFENYLTINTLTRFLFLGICVILLFASVSIFVERIANVFLMSLIFIFASISQIKVNLYYKLFFFLVIVGIDFFFLYKVTNIPGIDRPYQFLPYNFKID